MKDESKTARVQVSTKPIITVFTAAGKQISQMRVSTFQWYRLWNKNSLIWKKRRQKDFEMKNISVSSWDTVGQAMYSEVSWSSYFISFESFNCIIIRWWLVDTVYRVILLYPVKFLLFQKNCPILNLPRHTCVQKEI